MRGEKISLFIIVLMVLSAVIALQKPVFAEENLKVSEKVLDSGLPKKITLGAANSISDVVYAYFGFLEAAYAELGISLELVRLPMKRSYTSLDRGVIDGLVIANGSLIRNYKNIFIVPPALTRIEILVFTIDKEFEVNGSDSLKPYKIGIIRGYPLSTRLTEGMDRRVVNNYKSLFSVLSAGRVDVVLGLKRESLRFLAKNPQLGAVKKMEPPLLSFPLYHCLNKTHERLVPKLMPIIRRLLEEGLLEERYKPYQI